MPLPPLPTGLTSRALTAGDLEPVFAVYAADEVADAGLLALEIEDIEGDWARPSFALATDAIGVFDGGQLVGAAEVSRGGTTADGAVLPSARSRRIGAWLLAWTEERARAMGSNEVGQNVPAGSTAERALTANGYACAWTAWVLELPEGSAIPPRPLPPGFHLVTGDTPEREHAAYEVIEVAFGEWPSRTPQTFDDWRATTVDRPGSEPWQLRLVEVDGACVGAAFTILDTQRCGYVHQVAVRSDHRGRGLAQALLADAFERARARGAVRSELSTDSRTGALGLYEKVGMTVTSTWVQLRKPLSS